MSSSHRTHLTVVDLPRTAYLSALHLQNELVYARRTGRIGDVALLMEHPPTVTIGKRGNPASLRMSTGDLAALGVAVHTVDRGGAATYHGPGQIVCYPIIHLGQARLRVKEYVAKLEEAALRTIRSFGAKADTQEGRIGVWTGSHDKIASIGIRVTHRVTCHGLSLNVRLDRDPSRFVVTCDIADARQVSLTDIAAAPCTPAEVRAALTRSLADVLDVDVRVTRGEDW